MPALNRGELEFWLKIAHERNVDSGLCALVVASVDYWDERLRKIEDDSTPLIGPDDGATPIPVAGTNVQVFILARRSLNTGRVVTHEIFLIRPPNPVDARWIDTRT